MLIYKLVCIWNGDQTHYCYYYCYCCCQYFFAVICNRFPLRDANRLRQWLRNVRRINWTPSESSRLCSVHFEENDFCTNKEVDLLAQHVYVGGVNSCTIYYRFFCLYFDKTCICWTLNVFIYLLNVHIRAIGGWKKQLCLPFSTFHKAFPKGCHPESSRGAVCMGLWG